MVLVVKNPPANMGHSRVVGLIPGLGRSPGEGNGNPLQYFCLGIRFASFDSLKLYTGSSWHGSDVTSFSIQRLLSNSSFHWFLFPFSNLAGDFPRFPELFSVKHHLTRQSILMPLLFITFCRKITNMASSGLRPH